MEELLIPLIQFLLEVLLEVFVNLPFEWPNLAARKNKRDEGFGYLFLMFLGGCLLAWISTFLFPKSLITSPALRIANLIVAPILSGVVAWLIARHRALSNAEVRPRRNYWRAFWFTLGMVLVRFAYTQRG